MGSGEWGRRGGGGELVFLPFIGGGAPPVGCYQETRSWGGVCDSLRENS
ncbi:MAG: hypothetical protein DSM106950_05955 [Stigonema ocellatum SAG 48.90 = DSM 106950]|nr:hypothetical protein [Stigonema ocellatum SAG 48.90 = DSM 106950]